MVGKEAVLGFIKLIWGEDSDNPQEEARSYQQKREAADDFERGMDAFK